MLSLLILCGFRTPALAQTLLFAGATVHTVTGETWSPGQVLVTNGVIAAVGRTLAEPPDAQKINLAGEHLYPGLISLDTALGLTEIGAVRATEDLREPGEFTPDVESWVAVNPDSELIPVTRANGITFFQPVPQGGSVSGQSGLVSVDGWTTEQMVYKRPVALHVFWPEIELDTASAEREHRGKSKPPSLEEQAKERRAKLQGIVDFFDEARAYAKAKEAAAKGKVAAPQLVPAWEAMLPYVRGELPVFLHADEMRRIRSAVEWACTNGYKAVLAGGRDAWTVASLLASNKVPVVYDAVFKQPARETDPYDVHFSAPAKLHRAGVQVSFSAGETAFVAPMSRNLPYAAAQAVAFGLPADEALKGLTLYPARAVGAESGLGSIEPGKQATLFAADGDILDLRTNVKRMWIAGREITLQDRHTRLYEKYRDRPKEPARPPGAPSKNQIHRPE